MTPNSHSFLCCNPMWKMGQKQGLHIRYSVREQARLRQLRNQWSNPFVDIGDCPLLCVICPAYKKLARAEGKKWSRASGNDVCKFFAVREHKKVCILCSSGLCLHTGTHHVRVRRWLQVSDPPPPFYPSSARASKNTNTTMATVSDRAHGVPYPKATRGLRNTISLKWWVGGWVGVPFMYSMTATSSSLRCWHWVKCVLRAWGQLKRGLEVLALGEICFEGMGAVEKGVRGVGIG